MLEVTSTYKIVISVMWKFCVFHLPHFVLHFSVPALFQQVSKGRFRIGE